MTGKELSTKLVQFFVEDPEEDWLTAYAHAWDHLVQWLNEQMNGGQSFISCTCGEGTVRHFPDCPLICRDTVR